jgi:DNA modification methylase
MSEIKLWEGDCRNTISEIPDKSVDLILCDLPYGTTACAWDTIIPITELWEMYHRVIKPNGAICLFGINPFTSTLVASNPKEFRYDWIWYKNCYTRFLDANRRPLLANEYISVFYASQPTYNPQMRKGNVHKNGGNGAITTEIYRRNVQHLAESISCEYFPTTVLEFAVEQNNVHPTQKPVLLCEYLIRTYTNPGEWVLDNTMGSGTTGVACVNTNRNFYGMEMDPKYFKIASDRIYGTLHAKPMPLFDIDDFNKEQADFHFAAGGLNYE